MNEFHWHSTCGHFSAAKVAKKIIIIMKKLVIVTCTCLMFLNLAIGGEPSGADQKWLQAVEKMVADGQTKVSTPNKDRVSLLEKWADKKGYSLKTTKNELGFTIVVSKSFAKN